MLRNENIPAVHQVHAYDDADVKVPMAPPWMHELGCPFNEGVVNLCQKRSRYHT